MSKITSTLHIMFALYEQLDITGPALNQFNSVYAVLSGIRIHRGTPMKPSLPITLMSIVGPAPVMASSEAMPL